MSDDLEADSDAAKKDVVPATSTSTIQGMRVHHLMYAIIGCAVLAWLWRVTGFWIVLLFAAVMGAAAVCLALFIAKRNASQQESLLWALAIAAERSKPLPSAALVFADEYSATFRWKVRLFASLLTEGLTIPQALDRVPRLLSREAEALVKTGWSTGLLARSLRDAASIRDERSVAWLAAAVRFFYLGIVFLSLQLVSMFILYFITPKFEAIFKDFGLQLPPVTIFTIVMSHYFVDYGWITLILAFIELCIFVALPLGFFNVFQWDIPLLDWFYRRRHTPLILRSLGLTVEAGRPILSGFEQLAANYPSKWVKSRLVIASRDVQNGESWIAALQHRQLIGKGDGAVLAAAERVGNLLWALRETSKACERRIGYRLQFWIHTLFPFLVLLMGVFVLIFCVAYFSPIIRLIERLS